MNSDVFVVVYSTRSPYAQLSARQVPCGEALKVSIDLSEQYRDNRVSIMFGGQTLVHIRDGFVRQVNPHRFEQFCDRLDAIELAEMLDQADVSLCVQKTLWRTNESHA